MRVSKNPKKWYNENMDEKALFERLDKIIFLLGDAVKQPSLLVRVINGAAMGAVY
ncbi:MAG: hypothetical protein LBQ89_05940 [Treponema sp.]|jgi:hypothetical protein|nr:hypothetical protein [Treponema sp.]